MHDDDSNRRLVDDLRRELAIIQITNVAVMESNKSEISVLKLQISNFEKALLERVQRLEFVPVKLIAYALAGGTLTTVLGAILAKVVIK